VLSVIGLKGAHCVPLLHYTFMALFDITAHSLPLHQKVTLFRSNCLFYFLFFPFIIHHMLFGFASLVALAAHSWNLTLHILRIPLLK